MGLKQMAARFAGTCKNCQCGIKAGAQILWSRERGTFHATQAQCDEARAAKAAQPAAAIEAVSGAKAIADFLNAAKARGLKFPKVRFLAPDGQKELRLSVATERAKVPGSINVCIFGAWVGRILMTGECSPAVAEYPGLLATLARIAADPAAAAKAYGALMCRCSFCNLALTDAGSVEVGYGPICAKHYGLPHAPKGTPDVKAVAA